MENLTFIHNFTRYETLSFQHLSAGRCLHGQDQLAILEPVLPEGLGTKGEEITVQTNERYVFPAEKDFKAWVDIVTLEDRLAACEVPENLLHSMTTDALVRTVLNYPLFFIYSAYDNPLDAVDIIVKSSRLHRELFTRSDAAEVLLRHFDETYMDTSGRKSHIFFKMR